VTSRWLAISVAISNLLVPLNSTMIVVALPRSRAIFRSTWQATRMARECKKSPDQALVFLP